MMNTDSRSTDRRRLTNLLWLAVAVAPALYAMKGVFSFSKLFYVRDLGSYFYPNYLWIRHAVFAGQMPLWNPDSGAGYANVSDPSFQLFFLPTLPFRFLLPESVGFNFMVAFPIILAAIGTLLFLKRHVSLPSAVLGSIVFSISGPMLSSANSINPSTTAAMIPWLLWATDKLIERYSVARLSLLAMLFALAVFAGQPDILAWTALLVAFYAGFSVSEDSWGVKLKRLALTAFGGVLGLLLSAIQFFPLLDVIGRSHRGSGAMLDGWSTHPLSLLEIMMPNVFTSPLEPSSHLHPWLYQLNSGREPYLMSIYLGIATLLLALAGAMRGEPRRWAKFWAIAFGIFLVLALGYYTPVYKGLRAIVPFIGFFRYPSKLTIFMAFAVSALTALGFDAIKVQALELQAKSRAFRVPLLFACIVILFAASLAVLTIGFPESAGHLIDAFATKAGLENAPYALSDIVFELKQSSARLFGLALCAGLLLWVGVSKRKEAGFARATLFATIVLDLMIANSAINPTIELAKISQPDWVAATRTHPSDRIFVDDQSPISPAPQSPQFIFMLPPELSLSDADALYHSEVPYNSIKYGLRDAVIVDVTKLRPKEYTQMIKLFRSQDAESRTRFLQRIGVRYFLQPEPPACKSTRIQPAAIFATDKMALYECDDPAPRAAVVQEAEIEPAIEAQLDKLFQAEFDPAKKILLTAEPPLAGGKPAVVGETFAKIIEDGTDTLTVKAGAPEGGAFLLLRDSFDPNWRVEVDGESTPLLRANGLYRAVHFAQGEHLIHFAYRPRSLYSGAAITLLTAVVLGFLSLRKRRVVRLEVQKPEVVELLQTQESATPV
jgi:hypothetical protein